MSKVSEDGRRVSVDPNSFNNPEEEGKQGHNAKEAKATDCSSR